MTSEKVLVDMAALHSNFKINPSKLSGELRLSEQYSLRVDAEKSPDLWTVFDSTTGGFIPVKDIKGASKMTIGQFILDYKDICEGQEDANKDPLGNLKAGGFKFDKEAETPEAPEEVPPVVNDSTPNKTPEESYEEKARREREENERRLEALENGEIEKPVSKPRSSVRKEQPRTKALAIPDRMRALQISELTTQEIVSYLCPNASEKEATIFLKLCQARNLNPFLKEAYLIKYGERDPASMVVGKDAFARKAEQHPMYDGYEAGIIIKNEDGKLERREGTFMLPDEKLVGGWCKVYRKDRERPNVIEVALHEYQQRKSDGTLNKFWNEKTGKPATMIRKVAFSQCHREAFPGEFSGMYDGAELGINTEVIDAQWEEVAA